jgi:hypothetical protein
MHTMEIIQVIQIVKFIQKFYPILRAILSI